MAAQRTCIQDLLDQVQFARQQLLVDCQDIDSQRVTVSSRVAYANTNPELVAVARAQIAELQRTNTSGA